MQVNWKEYFREFCAMHGQHYVLWNVNPDTKKGGWFLFPDGWLYGRIPSGPEIAPETKERRLYLIKMYWSLRRGILKEELRKQADECKSLVHLQSSRSSPIVVNEAVVDFGDNGEETRRIVSVPLDFNAMLTKIRDTRKMLQECEDKINQIKEESYQPPSEATTNFNAAAILAELEEIEHGRPAEKS